MHLKIKLGLLLVLFSGQTYAQDLLHQLINESCNHFRNGGYTEMPTYEVEEKMTIYFGNLFQQHAQEIRDSFDLNIYDSRESAEFGERFGVKLTKRCPLFLQLMLRIEEAELKDFRQDEEGSIEGTLIRFEGKEIIYFIMKDEQEQEHKLLWLGYFWGSENFYHNRNRMIGKRYRIRYKERSYFSPERNNYEWVKEITDLDFR